MRRILISAFIAMAAAAPAQAATVFGINLTSEQEVAPAGAQTVPQSGVGTARIVRQGRAFALDFDLAFDTAFDFAPILGNPDFPFTLPPGEIGDVGARTGLEVTRLHIHNAPRGQNGPVVFGLINPNSEIDLDTVVDQFLGGTRVTGTWGANEGQAGATFADFAPTLFELSAGQDAPLYFNLHTANDPAGAIRGQLVAMDGADIAPIPVPAALPLLGAGLVALGLLRRRRTPRA